MVPSEQDAQSVTPLPTSPRWAFGIELGCALERRNCFGVTSLLRQRHAGHKVPAWMLRRDL